MPNRPRLKVAFACASGISSSGYARELARIAPSHGAAIEAGEIGLEFREHTSDAKTPAELLRQLEGSTHEIIFITHARNLLEKKKLDGILENPKCVAKEDWLDPHIQEADREANEEAKKRGIVSVIKIHDMAISKCAIKWLRANRKI